MYFQLQCENQSGDLQKSFKEPDEIYHSHNLWTNLVLRLKREKKINEVRKKEKESWYCSVCETAYLRGASY